MNRPLHITLIECDNSECPNIGTLTFVEEHNARERCIAALESHFDGEVTGFRIQGGLNITDVLHISPIDSTIDINGEYTANIEIQQTFLF